MPATEFICLEDTSILAIERALQALSQPGGVIVFPTDTVYGLIAALDDEAGYNAIFDIKKRPLNQPLQVLTLTHTSLAQDACKMLAAWPKWLAGFNAGMVTAVLDAGCFTELPQALATIQPGPVGVRLPHHTPLQELLKHLPHNTVWATSANVSGTPSATTASELRIAMDRWLPSVPLAIISQIPRPGHTSRVIQVHNGDITALR